MKLRLSRMSLQHTFDTFLRLNSITLVIYIISGGKAPSSSTALALTFASGISYSTAFVPMALSTASGRKTLFVTRRYHPSILRTGRIRCIHQGCSAIGANFLSGDGQMTHPYTQRRCGSILMAQGGFSSTFHRRRLSLYQRKDDDDENDESQRVGISNIGLSSQDPTNHHIPLISAECTRTSPYDDEDLLESYQSALIQIKESKRMRLMKKETQRDLDIAMEYLQTPYALMDAQIPSLSSSNLTSITDIHDQKPISSGKNVSDSTRSIVKRIFQDEMRAQRESFLEKYSSLTNRSSNDNETLTKVQLGIAQRILTYMGDHCAKHGTASPLFIAWEKVKEMGMIPRDKAISTYLYVMTLSFNTDDQYRDIHDGSAGGKMEDRGSIHSQSSSSRSTVTDVINEVATFHDLLHKPTENTITLRIKCFMERGDAAGARAILRPYLSSLTLNEEDSDDITEKKVSLEIKMRTYFPILEFYLRQNDVDSTLDLYKEMKHVPTVYFDANIYTMILTCLARNGYFCPSKTNPEHVPIHGYNYGPSLLDALTQDMAQDILEVSGTNATAIRNAITIGFGDLSQSSNLQQVPFDCGLIPNNNPITDPDTVVASRVKVNPGTGICPRTHVKLQLYTLEEDQKIQMFDTLLDMADNQFELFDAKLESRSQKPKNMQYEKDFARKELEKFATWLASRKGPPFTAIVDGANVAYYGLGTINYHQIKMVVDRLESMNENPLVIMPQKYVNEKFYLRKGFVQELPKEQMDIIEDLTRKGQIYVVPQRCLDDYYWMLSSVAKQPSHERKEEESNPTSDWIGTRPMLITNDQMRDHKLELLKPRLFRRWFESHIVNYHFTPLHDNSNPLNASDDGDAVTLAMADNFSKEIQGNLCTLSDNGRTKVWHFPVSDWEKNDRFCIRIPFN